MGYFDKVLATVRDGFKAVAEKQPEDDVTIDNVEVVQFQIIFKEHYIPHPHRIEDFLKTVKALCSFENPVVVTWRIVCESGALSFYYEIERQYVGAFTQLLHIYYEDMAEVYNKGELSRYDVYHVRYITLAREGSLTSFIGNETKISQVLQLMEDGDQFIIDFQYFDHLEGNNYFRAEVSLSTLNKHRDNTIQTLASVCASSIGDAVLRISNKRSEENMLLSGQELSHFISGVHIEKQAHLIPQLTYLRKSQVMLADGEFDDGLCIGELDHPVQQHRPVHQPFPQLEKHTVATGEPGSGKSAFLGQKAKEIIDSQLHYLRTGEMERLVGLTAFDPAIALNHAIINYIQFLEIRAKDNLEELALIERLWERVHVIDFGSDVYTFPINFLDTSLGEQSVDLLRDLFADVFGAGQTAKMDKTLRNVFTILFNDPIEEHQVNDMYNFLKDEVYRQKIIERVEDVFEASHAVKELQHSTLTGADIDPLINRLTPFLTNSKMKRTFQYGANKLQVSKWLRNGEVVLFTLKNIPTIMLKICIGYIGIQYYHRAFDAVKHNEFFPKHILMIDESQEVQVPIIIKIIQELRKVGVGVDMATQSVQSYTKDFLKGATLMGTKVTFRQVGIGAKKMVEIMNKDVTERELGSLPDRHGIMRTQENGEYKVVGFVTPIPYQYLPSGAVARYKHPEDDQRVKAFIDEKYQELMQRTMIQSQYVTKKLKERWLEEKEEYVRKSVVKEKIDIKF